MKFKDVIGQEEAKRQLLQLVVENRVPHAMLLCGPMGCGKMALALALASFLLGERDDSDPLEAEAAKNMPELSPEKKRNAEAMLANIHIPISSSPTPSSNRQERDLTTR